MGEGAAPDAGCVASDRRHSRPMLDSYSEMIISLNAKPGQQTNAGRSRLGHCMRRAAGDRNYVAFHVLAP